MGGYRCEANDVAEVDCYFGELFRFDGESQLEAFGNGAVKSDCKLLSFCFIGFFTTYFGKRLCFEVMFEIEYPEM